MSLAGQAEHHKKKEETYSFQKSKFREVLGETQILLSGSSCLLEFKTTNGTS